MEMRTRAMMAIMVIVLVSVRLLVKAAAGEAESIGSAPVRT